jgi:hypothetical protein
MEKLNHFEDIYGMVTSTIRAWHSNYYYASMFQKLESTFNSYKADLLNPSISTFNLKMKSLASSIFNVFNL